MSDWINTFTAQMRHANAQMPDILAELRSQGLLRPMRAGPYQSDKTIEYIPGYEEEWDDKWTSTADLSTSRLR